MHLAAGGKTGSASQLSAHQSRLPLHLEIPPVRGNRRQDRARAHLVSFAVELPKGNGEMDGLWEGPRKNVQVAGFVRVARGLV